MNAFQKSIDIRWSDLDPNFHLRHSVYYDWGASTRVACLEGVGLTMDHMQEWKIGPILFREECIFRREIHFKDSIVITLVLTKATPAMDRWSMQHEIWKNGDTLSAIINIDGAWIDTQLRKLTIPPALVRAGFEQIPKSADFQWTNK